MWLSDKYPVEIKTQLHLFARIKEGREGIMSFSVMRVCLYLNLMCKYVDLRFEVYPLYLKLHLRHLLGAQGNKTRDC